ncbi:hypothetical protein QJS04_geneDACA013412 [Acorus gramineus]|uniref:Uncharacterized protein n=1 Tax=Acorus gramineus TaxID=55184 RepID=A0AAV9AA03_ACOGR|nr:hypothetical protein QJS04_geneDACA013412 [Acorus gramineus]
MQRVRYTERVVERNASSDAEIGRLWKFDGYHDSLGEVDRSPLGDDAFKLLQGQKIFLMGCLVFSFKEYIKTSLGDPVKDMQEEEIENQAIYSCINFTRK